MPRRLIALSLPPRVSAAGAGWASLGAIWGRGRDHPAPARPGNPRRAAVSFTRAPGEGNPREVRGTAALAPGSSPTGRASERRREAESRDSDGAPIAQGYAA